MQHLPHVRPTGLVFLLGLILGLSLTTAHAQAPRTLQALLDQLGPDEKTLRIDDIRFNVEALRKTIGITRDDGLPAGLTLWTDGIVYYTFAAQVSPNTREKFDVAFAAWQHKAGIEFQLRSKERNYVEIVEGQGNFSDFGMEGGVQTLSVTPGAPIGFLIHELGHTLGLIHEHQREDRDEYVRIVEENIVPFTIANFDLFPGAVYTCTIYDFASIMHYSPTAFSTNDQPTIEALPAYADQAHKMGQIDSLTFYDALDVSRMYGYRPGLLPPRLFKQETELKWSQAPDVDSYQLQVARDLSFEEVVYDQYVSAAGIAPFETVRWITTDLLPSTTYYWRVQSVHAENETAWTRKASFVTSRAAPDIYWFYPTYPNPARTEVHFPYELERPAQVTIRVFNTLGQDVAAFELGRQNNGLHELRWQADGHPAGLYFVQFQAGHLSQIRKVLLVR